MMRINKDYDDFVTSPPRIIFEVLSPATGFKDRNVKFRLYEEEKVKYYIMVDIYAGVSEIFILEGGSYQKLMESQHDSHTFNICDYDIEFNFSKIWN